MILSYSLLPRVLRGHARDGPVNVRNLAQAAQVVVVDVQIAQQNHVVLAAPIVAHRAKHVGQRVELLGRFVGIGVNVDQRKREGLVGRRTAHAKPAHQRLAMQQVVGIGHRVQRVAIDLDAGRVEDERVLLLALGAPQPRADHVIVVPAGGVDRVDELRQDVLLRANLLNGDDVEVANDLGQQAAHARVRQLLLAEHLNVERSDANRAALPLDARQREAGLVAQRPRTSVARGASEMRSRPLNLIVLKEVPAAADRRPTRPATSTKLAHAPLRGQSWKAPWRHESVRPPTIWRFWAAKDSPTPDSAPGQFRVLAHGRRRRKSERSRVATGASGALRAPGAAIRAR